MQMQTDNGDESPRDRDFDDFDDQETFGNPLAAAAAPLEAAALPDGDGGLSPTIPAVDSFDTSVIFEQLEAQHLGFDPLGKLGQLPLMKVSPCSKYRLSLHMMDLITSRCC